VAIDANILIVNGVLIPETAWGDYVIRFVVNQVDAIPALYYKGHRVVTAWRMDAAFEVPEDTYGGNANTC